MRAQSERAEATATPRTRRQRKTAAACGAYPFSQTHKPINGQRLGLAEVRLGAQHAHGQAVAARRVRQANRAVKPLVLIRIVVREVDLRAVKKGTRRSTACMPQRTVAAGGRSPARASRSAKCGLHRRRRPPRPPLTCSSIDSIKFRFFPSGFSPAAKARIFATESFSSAASTFAMLIKNNTKMCAHPMEAFFFFFFFFFFCLFVCLFCFVLFCFVVLFCCLVCLFVVTHAGEGWQGG